MSQRQPPRIAALLCLAFTAGGCQMGDLYLYPDADLSFEGSDAGLTLRRPPGRTRPEFYTPAII